MVCLEFAVRYQFNFNINRYTNQRLKTRPLENLHNKPTEEPRDRHLQAHEAFLHRRPQWKLTLNIKDLQLENLLLPAPSPETLSAFEERIIQTTA